MNPAAATTGAGLEWGEVAALIMIGGFLLTLIGFAVGVAVKVQKGESAQESARKAHERLDGLARELGEFKAEVARDYVSHATLERLEARVIDAINRLGDRLDRAFETRRRGGQP